MPGLPRCRLLGALSLGLVMALVGCGGTEVRPPQATTATGDDPDVRAAQASAVLRDLARALNGGRGTREVTDLSAPDEASKTAVRAIADNAANLGLREVDFRYVDTENDALPEAVSKRYGRAAWAASVQATWTLPTFDPGPVTVPARFVFVTTNGRTRLVSAGGGSDRGALWLDGPAQISKTANTLVVVAQRGEREPNPRLYETDASRAVADVAKVLPAWRGPLVVEVPAAEQDLERLLGAAHGTYASIAAVTTTQDGSNRPGTPVHVFVNPQVFDGLGPRGSQVVLSHEATHVATEATFADMPTWLLEGFADYVALAHAGIPIDTAAAQILKQVRKSGPPDALPTTEDFAPSAEALGAVYEEAWTVLRFMGEQYGEAKVVALYDAVDQGQSVEAAFRAVLGTTQRAFVSEWSADLANLARGSAQ